MWTRSELQVLDEVRCRELLATTTIGRLAWRAVDGLAMLPVSYVPYGSGVAFRTSSSGSLAGLTQPTDVVFEADQLDPETQTGWSVVLRGRAEAVAEPSEVVRLWTVDDLTPWADGIRNLFIQVEPRVLTGRLFTAGQLPDDP